MDTAGGAAPFPSPPETRARSRSKTPFTKAAEENGKDGKKSPDLQAITEDLETTASSTPIKTSKRQASQKTVAASASTTTTTVIQTSSSSTTTTRKSATNGSSESSKKANVSKEMKELENKRTKEIKQNEVNEKIVKKSVTSTPKMSPNTSSHSASFKLNSSHEDLDLDKHPAYKEYIQAGEFWNKTPKTDYTYSETSVHRRDIGQGYVGMPNMSRKSLDRHVERVNTMIRNNPEQESYLRQRYQVNPSSTMRNSNKSFKLFSRSLLNYDSGDEVDMSQFDRRTTMTRQQQESIVKRTVVRVWVWFTSLFTVFSRRTSVTRQQYQAQYGVQKVSLWSRLKIVTQRSWTWLWSQVVSVFKKIYVFLATVLYFDTLLVRQRRIQEAATVEKGAGDASTVTAADVELLEETVEEMPKSKKRFLLILAILLPILLLAGVVANNNLETAQIRAFLAASEQQMWERVALAKAGVNAWRLTAAEVAQRNYDTVQWKALELADQAKVLWAENSEKVVQMVKEASQKLRSSQQQQTAGGETV